MNKSQLLAVLVIVAGIALAGVYIAQYQPEVEPSTSVSNAEDSAVRAAVEGFGRSLQQVSLLAPNAGAQLAAVYAPFVAPELIAQWQASTTMAPGRQTSSPWPDSIDIASITAAGSGAYTVDGNVLEVAQGDSGVQPVAVYPVSMRVELRNDAWLITSFTRGDYQTLPQLTTVVGTWECLPHKNTSGPQTDECAFGIAADAGGHYAVDSSLMSRYPVDYATGTKVRIRGIITPVEALSSIQKYDIRGIIRATTIDKI